MKPKFAFILIPAAFLFTSSAQGAVDHTCTDLGLVPDSWIETVQDDIPSHYAHTSHGGQLTYGLQFIEADSSFYDYHLGSSYLPITSGAWCIFDGQENGTYIGPELYWQTEEGMNLTRDVLDNNPTIKTSMWSWCTQLNSYNESQVQAYLDSMTVLESEYPGVTFVYLTGNAQGTGSGGYNRWQRNEQIRDYCTVNNKMLFDFADLDCWWYNPSSTSWEQHTYSYSGDDIPAEHPEFYGDEYGHTTYESCYQKGKALWYLMALIAGWQGVGITEPETENLLDFCLSAVNPSLSSARFSYTVPANLNIDISIYSVDGRLVGIPVNGEMEAGSHNVIYGELQPGLYLIVMRADDPSLTISETMIIF